MTVTAHMGLTLLESAQAQKEITINEALARLDAILNAGVIDRHLATPPASPDEGDVYIVASGAKGAWSGKEAQVAYFDQVWRFIVPNAGLTLWVSDENAHYVYNGSAWVASGGGGGVAGWGVCEERQCRTPVCREFPYDWRERAVRG